MTKITTKQNLNRLLAFTAFMFGYILSILDDVYKGETYTVLNNLSESTFLGIYIVYILIVFLLIFLVKKTAIGFSKMKENFLMREYIWNGLRLFILGFFAGFVTLIGNNLVLISIPV